MISVISTTGKYILQPGLVDMHRQSSAWQSAAEFWKKELSFFQKLLDRHATFFKERDDKKRIDHFQNVITYYSGEVVDDLRKKLRDHEKGLAEMLQKENESDTRYFTEHQELMDAAQTFEKSFLEFKTEFFAFIERAMN